jgi:hypothetical protein
MFLRKPYKTSEEFYNAVERLIRELRTNGNAEDAECLDAIHRGVWTTGSELIGELMLALAKMKGAYPAQIRKHIADCRYFAKHHRRILGLD